MYTPKNDALKLNFKEIHSLSIVNRKTGKKYNFITFRQHVFIRYLHYMNLYRDNLKNGKKIKAFSINNYFVKYGVTGANIKFHIKILFSSRHFMMDFNYFIEKYKLHRIHKATEENELLQLFNENFGLSIIVKHKINILTLNYFNDINFISNMYKLINICELIMNEQCGFEMMLSNQYLCIVFTSRKYKTNYYVSRYFNDDEFMLYNHICNNKINHIKKFKNIKKKMDSKYVCCKYIKYMKEELRENATLFRDIYLKSTNVHHDSIYNVNMCEYNYYPKTFLEKNIGYNFNIKVNFKNEVYSFEKPSEKKHMKFLQNIKSLYGEYIYQKIVNEGKDVAAHDVVQKYVSDVNLIVVSFLMKKNTIIMSGGTVRFIHIKVKNKTYMKNLFKFYNLL